MGWDVRAQPGKEGVPLSHRPGGDLCEQGDVCLSRAGMSVPQETAYISPVDRYRWCELGASRGQGESEHRVGSESEASVGTHTVQL